jgi:hypothetical protein
MQARRGFARVGWHERAVKWVVLAAAVVLVISTPSRAHAYDFVTEDVHSTDNVQTVLGFDYSGGSNGDYVIGYVEPNGTFAVSVRATQFGYDRIPIAGNMKTGPGTLALLNLGQTDGYRPTFATIRSSDGRVIQWYKGGFADEWYILVEGPSGATTVSIARDENGNDCYAYTKSNGELWFDRRYGYSVVFSQMIAGNAQGTPSLALDSDGRARIAYRDGGNRIVFAQESFEGGGSWGWMYVSTGDGDSPSLRIGSINRPMIAFHSSQGLMFAQGGGNPTTTGFVVTNVLAGGPEMGTSPCLRLTFDTEFPWIASCDGNNFSVNLTQRLGNVGEPWVTTTVAEGLSFPTGTSLFIHGHGTPALSYSSSGDALVGGIDFATAGVWIAHIQDQGVEGQTFQATWGGKGPVIVESSTDGGTSWQSLVETSNSPAVFTLPAVQTDAARIRIRRPSDGEIAVSPNPVRIVPRTTPPNPISQRRWSAPGVGGERRGYSLANAGDVNGDGYDDMIAGAPLYDQPGAYAGRAYVYFGGPSADAVADLTLTSPGAGSLFGISVAGVGDINHDGYADFAVGAPYFTAPATSTGRVFVYYGGPTPDAVVDVTLSGSVLGETFGTSVAGLGDVNGDGYDDMIAGAPAHDGAGGAKQDAGRADLFFGGPMFDATRDQSIEGAAAFDEFGYSVGGGGDVNGDGAMDFVVGAHYADNAGGTESGKVYLFLGGSKMDKLADAIQPGRETGGQLGYSVAIVGDVNGDGLADIAAGAPYENASAGRGYLWGGSRSWINPGPLDVSVSPGPPTLGLNPGPPTLETNPGPPTMVLAGEGAGSQLGASVAAMGDLNGDCYAEVGFGSPAYGFNVQGRAYIVLGGTAPDPAVRYVLEGASGEVLGMSLTALRRSASGAPARAIVSGFTLAGSPGGAGFVSMHDVSRYVMQSPSGGGTWPVGALREVKWLGREPANIDLSVDGGATWTTVLANVGGQGLNVASIRVPHTPTRFARLRATPPNPILPPSPVLPPNPVVPPSPILPPSPIGPCAPDSWVAVSDSFFTIQTSVSLLALLAAPAPNGAGAVVTWNSDPGPEDLAGYRLERASGSGPWSTAAALTRERSFTDAQAGPATRYRLFAVNGLNEELMLGETAFRPHAPLTAWPTPYRGGEMTIAFATHGGWGGGAARSEVTLFDVRGRLVRRIADGSYEAGLQSAVWDGRDGEGRRVAAGLYFLRAKSAGEERTLKLVVAR